MKKAEVNFSDRSPKRIDPHDWRSEQGKLVLSNGRVVQVIEVFVCGKCNTAVTLPPKFIHDLPECVECPSTE